MNYSPPPPTPLWRKKSIHLQGLNIKHPHLQGWIHMNKIIKYNKYRPLPPRQLHHQIQQDKNTPKIYNNKYNNSAVAILQAINITYHERHTGTIPERKHRLEFSSNSNGTHCTTNYRVSDKYSGTTAIQCSH